MRDQYKKRKGVTEIDMSTHGKEDRKRIATPFTEAELYQIDDWGFARRMRDRSQMVRELVFLGLQSSRNEKSEASA